MYLPLSSERFSEMLGYSREEMLGCHVVEFVHEDYKDFMAEQVARRQRGEEARSYEIDWRAKDGQRVYTLISPKGFYDANGQFTGSLGVLTGTLPTESGRKRRCKKLTPN